MTFIAAYVRRKLYDAPHGDRRAIRDKPLRISVWECMCERACVRVHACINYAHMNVQTDAVCV